MPIFRRSSGGGQGAGGQESDKYLPWQILAQATVVILGLAAVVGSLALILDAYDVDEAPTMALAATTASADVTGTSNKLAGQTGGANGTSGGSGPTGPGGGSPTEETTPSATPAPEATSVSSSSVVAILTPIMAGIVGIAGLFFGISGTGSARGREAGTEQAAADTTAKALDLATEIQQESKPQGNDEGNGQSRQGGTSPPTGDDGF